MRLGLATSIALLAALAAVPAAARDYPVELRAPIPKSGRVMLNEQIGPILFTEVLIQDAPTEAELRRARPDQEDDPRPVLVVSHKGNDTAILRLRVTLEDDQGTEYLTCKLKENVDEDTTNETILACQKDQEMRVRDWPKVTTLHLAGKVDADDKD